MLFVPTIDSVVEIRGEVRRPMAYELSGGNGGQPHRYGRRIHEGGVRRACRSCEDFIRRWVTNSRVSKFNGPKLASMPIRDGDILTVPSTGDRVANGIKLRGGISPRYLWLAPGFACVRSPQ